MRGTLAERFWDKVAKKGPDECWLWTGHQENGYARLRIGKTTRKSVQRISWELHNKSIPSGAIVRCKCGVRTCVNPAHLFLVAPKTLEQRFWSKVNKKGPDECWLWTAGKDKFGYGKIQHGKRPNAIPMLAHRVSWELHSGQIPSDLCVLHHCDIPACVNPTHLFLGTREDNLRDMREKGRHVKGSDAEGAKLTEQDVREIRHRHATTGETYRAISADFPVTETQISNIVRRKRWRHVD